MSRMKYVESHVCSVARTMIVLGDRWTMLIIRNIFLGQRKFSTIQKSLQINKNRLSERLTLLVEEGILKKMVYDEVRNRFEYKLTPKGYDLWPMLHSMMQWGDKWAADEDGVPVELEHKRCGHKTRPVYCCSECGDPVDVWQIKAVPGPGVTKKLERGDPVRNMLLVDTW